MKKTIQVFSFVREAYDLHPVEIEVSLLPGLPQFQIMGLPDASLRESHLRIKSALKHQGFSLFPGKQILINLKPNHLRKKSQGLELAIACAYLWKTGQVTVSSFFDSKSTLFIYGGLSLEGQVEIPEDLELMSSSFLSSSKCLLSGHPKEEKSYPFPLLALKSLKDLREPKFFPASAFSYKAKRPSLPSHRYFSKLAGDLLVTVAAGGHSLLIAGPAGSGKTHFAETLHFLLPSPCPEKMASIQKTTRLFGYKTPLWPPFIHPHHSIPPMSMLGGGEPPFPGELTRAHGGLLFLDEFLSFHNEVKENLREPVEKGEVTVARRGKVKTFPAQFQLVAATNLCHCGKLAPLRNFSCSFSLRRCRSYLDRLSGPLLDRFEILFFSHEWNQRRTLSLLDLLQRVKDAVFFSKAQRKQSKPNSQLKREEIEVDSFLERKLLPEFSESERRRLALLRVARTLADIDKSKTITSKHTEKAYNFTLKPFQQIQKIFS